MEVLGQRGGVDDVGVRVGGWGVGIVFVVGRVGGRRGSGGRTEDGQVGHFHHPDDAVGAVGQQLAAVGGQAEEGYETAAEFGAVDHLAGFGFDDVKIAFRRPGDDVVAVRREDGRRGGLFQLGLQKAAVDDRCRGKFAFARDWVGDVDEVGFIFEQRSDE